MNNFAEIILVHRFKKVTYYSVSINNDKSLYDKFIEKHTIENKEKLYHILSWIEKLGSKIGAKEFYFRNEANISDTSALPPKGWNIEPVYVEFKQKKKNNLRLYCFRANEKVVFLFNGDVKTTSKAQDCRNVKSHFMLANQLTKLLNQAFKDNCIKWNEYYSDIEIKDDFRLEFD